MTKENIKKNNKKNKGLIITNIILVIIILVVALLIYIAIDEDIIIFNKDNYEKVNINKVVNNNTNKEKTITDSNTIVELKNKVNYLNATKIYLDHIIPNLYKEEKITYIREEDKLNIVLESLKNDYTDITIPQSEIEKSLGLYYVDSIIKDNKQISIDKVKERYNELFGSNINNFYNIEGCPTFLYDSINNLYYEVSKCTKGETINKEYRYDIKYTMDNNLAYVYVSIGTAFESDINNNDIDKKLNIYKGYTKAIYKEEVTIDDVKNFKIDKDNYKEFDIYKYKFFKDTSSNNYYFISVEKIK